MSVSALCYPMAIIRMTKKSLTDSVSISSASILMLHRTPINWIDSATTTVSLFKLPFIIQYLMSSEEKKSEIANTSKENERMKKVRVNL